MNRLGHVGIHIAGHAHDRFSWLRRNAQRAVRMHREAEWLVRVDAASTEQAAVVKWMRSSAWSHVMRDRGQRLHYAMLLRGYRKQHALAHHLGVAESTITRWKGNKAISVDHAIALCAALDISLDWFLRGIGPIEAPVCDHSYATNNGTIGLDVEETAPAWILTEPSLARYARYNH